MKLQHGILIAFLVVIAVVGYGVYCIHRTATVTMPNAYAADWASEFVIEHLKSSGNRWPKGWHDLRDEFDRLNDVDSYPWSWQELQSLVVIDWQAEPAKLARALSTAEPPFRVIRLSDGSATHFDGSEPNRKVFDYLQTTALNVLEK